MPGRTVLHVWCSCGHKATIPYRDEWDALLRGQMLPKFRCSACGGRPNDMRRGWEGFDHPAPGKVVPISSQRGSAG